LADTTQSPSQTHFHHLLINSKITTISIIVDYYLKWLFQFKSKDVAILYYLKLDQILLDIDFTTFSIAQLCLMLHFYIILLLNASSKSDTKDCIKFPIWQSQHSLTKYEGIVQ
jgi:hypothetical protein